VRIEQLEDGAAPHVLKRLAPVIDPPALTVMG